MNRNKLIEVSYLLINIIAGIAIVVIGLILYTHFSNATDRTYAVLAVALAPLGICYISFSIKACLKEFRKN
jgi:hypothetical protein